MIFALNLKMIFQILKKAFSKESHIHVRAFLAIYYQAVKPWKGIVNERYLLE